MQAIANLFFQLFHWIIPGLFNKSDLFVIVFIEEVSEFIDCDPFSSSTNAELILYYILGKQKSKQWSYMDEKIA